MLKTGRFLLLLLVVLCIPVGVLLFWHRGLGDLGGPVTYSRAAVCMDLDEMLEPVDPGSSFPWGVRQICLRFEFETPRPGATARIKWLYREQPVFLEAIQISENAGVKAFYLLREDGTPLPVGSYRVVIESGGKEKVSLPFAVSR